MNFCGENGRFILPPRQDCIGFSDCECREEWFWRHFLNGRQGLKALGIGAGRGETELRLLTTGTISRYDLYDIASKALDDARLTAETIGVANWARFIDASIHSVDFEDEAYDLITFIASMHHINDLEHILQKCYRALAPGGVLWAAEYIGPDYFDFPAEHTRLATHLWRGLDSKLTKSWEPALRFPTVEEVIAADPTEAVCSSRIIDAMAATFPELQIVPTYGTFAFILFWGLNPDAIYENADGGELVEAVMEIDSALIDSQRLPHYFAYAIGRKPVPGTTLSSDLFQLARSLNTGISGGIFKETRRHRLAIRR